MYPYFQTFKSKCDQYWPEHGTENYGDLDITLVREDILAFYTLRTFTMQQMKGPEVETSKKKRKGSCDFNRWFAFH